MRPRLIPDRRRRPWLAVCATFLAVTSGFTQMTQSPDINLFGDELPQKISGAGNGQVGRKANSNHPHSLVFRDGRQLHGELVEVTPEEVVWRRSDLKEALHFSRSEVRRIALAEVVPEMQSTFPGDAFFGNSGRDPNASQRSSRSMPATLKLPAGDWLFGEITSKDGENFSLQFDGGRSVAIRRAQMEWLHFSQAPAWGFGFFGSPLDLEDWLPPAHAAEVAGGLVTMPGAEWIGRVVAPLKRFEVALEVPADSEEGTQLWLQPFGPQVNCYSTGTVQSIAFTGQPSPPREPIDVLVFKNGDELPGRVFSAGTNAPIHWKSVSGQEVEIQPARVAGIHLAKAPEVAEPRATVPAATIEMRNGERLRGALLALDEKQLQVQHPQLGALALDRTQLWHVFPSPQFAVDDGGREPEAWIRETNPQAGQAAGKKSRDLASWTCLDGTFLLHGGANYSSGNTDSWKGLEREIQPGLERFEVRFEGSSPVATATNLFMQVYSLDTGVTWQASISYNEAHLVVYGLNLKTGMEASPYSEVADVPRIPIAPR